MRQLVLLVVAVLSVAGASGARMDRSKLQIGTYCLATYARSEAQVKAIRDCGVDFVYGVPASDRATLDWCAKHGLGVIATGAIPFWHGSNDRGMMHVQRPKAAFEAAMAKFADHPAIWMIDFVDEASAVDFEHIGNIMRYLQTAAPEGVGIYDNLYPNYASVIVNSSERARSQLGTATYAEHVAEYVRLVPLDYISFDFYVYSALHRNRLKMLDSFYDNFQVVSEACRKNGKSVWFIPQVNSKFKSMWLSENHLRFQAYLAMAYGAEVINWACWSREVAEETKETAGLTGWWDNNVLTYEGKQTEQYAKLRKVNAEIHRLGPAYMRYRNVGTRLVGPNRQWTVGDMVMRTDSSRKAMFVLASGDPFDEHPAMQRFEFKAAKPKASGGNGEVPLEDCGGGKWAMTLPANAGALVELR